MTLTDVRAAAVDRALVGDDPTAALALAGVVDSVARHGTGDGGGDPDDATPGDPFTAAMLAIGCVGAATSPPTRALDERAWHPGHDADGFVVAGAAVAVRERGVTIERAADLADCTPATLDAVVARQRREKEN